MSKLIITKWKGRALTARLEDGRFRGLSLESEEGKSLLGNIYIAKVKNVVKNIGAAFLDLGDGLTGYYSLAENPVPLFASQAGQFARRPAAGEDSAVDSLTAGEHSAAGVPAAGEDNAAGASTARTISRPIRPGDELVVQVSRDAVKTKEPTLTCCLNFPGKYAVVTLGKTQLGFSAKIRDEAWKSQLRRLLAPLLDGRFGVIVRTNAYGVPPEQVTAEIAALEARMEELMARAACRTCYTVLQTGNPSYIQDLRDASKLEEILTDEPEYFDGIRAYLEENQPQDLEKLRFYQDESLPLSKLCSLETAIREASGSRVWLKSGGYLVIEPTEALTVIDVNTGKYAGKKTPRAAILKINLEAACEAARQLSLRNLSGIILIDFIDMEEESDQALLLETLEQELKRDPVKTVLVDLTKLGLVEITRKKVRRPWHEALRETAQQKTGSANMTKERGK